MHRIDHPTAVASLPTPSAAGTPGYFTEGNPGLGVAATVLTADAANAMQEEICNVISGAGISLSKLDNTQLRAAILKMISDAARTVIIDAATFDPSVTDGEAVRWDSANNRFDEAIADGTANGNALGIADVTNARVYSFGAVGLFSGLTGGAKYYLSDSTAGAITATAPAGHKVIVGIARSATELFVDIDSVTQPEAVSKGNSIINGCCRVAQRAAPGLSNAYQYGRVDRFAAKADGTVGAGYISQSTTAECGRTGYALHLSGVTLSGGAEAVYVRYRMESLDARQHKNQNTIFHCKVYHDVGTAKNFTITINKANAADNFSAVTQIGVSSSQPVNSATETTVSFMAAMGDCSNGIEIIVKCDCGTVTTKNFMFAEMQFEAGSVATEFERQDYPTVEQKALRFCEVLQSGTGVNELHGTGISGAATFAVWIFKVRKRVTPVMTATVTGSTYATNTDFYSVALSSGSYQPMIACGATADAEL